MAAPGRCYVSAPVGQRPLPDGTIVDFDLVYQQAVSPAVTAAGLTPLRADTVVSLGSAERSIIELLARAEVMIADISVPDPMIAYGLGMRHVLAPRTTLLLYVEGTSEPDLLSSMAYAGSGAAALSDLRERLAAFLGSLGESGPVDSPFYQLFPVEPISLPDDPLGLRRRRKEAESLRARLLEIRQLLPEEGVDRLRALERDCVDAGFDDDRMRIDLMLAFRNFSAWDDVLRLSAGFPRHLAESPTVVQQRALARNRRGLPGDADRAAADLQALLERIGPDSETYGLLGRIHKDRYQQSGDRDELHAAIDAYRQGWTADPQDYYPGVNLVTLLTLAGGEAWEAEARSVAPRLRAIVDKRISSPPVDYWEIATALELAAIDRDWVAADELIDDTRARAAAGWMIDTTANNLRMLAGAMPSSHDRLKMDQLVRRLAVEAETR